LGVYFRFKRFFLQGLLRCRDICQTERYKCRECNETFFEHLPDMDESRLITRRLIKWLEKASLKKPFTSIAEDIGVNEKTVRNIFQDYVVRLEQKQATETPKWLGIEALFDKS
jgi:transposase